jgi:hypothetical protein
MPPHLSGNSDSHSPSPWRIAPGLCLVGSSSSEIARALSNRNAHPNHARMYFRYCNIS